MACRNKGIKAGDGIGGGCPRRECAWGKPSGFTSDGEPPLPRYGGSGRWGCIGAPLHRPRCFAEWSARLQPTVAASMERRPPLGEQPTVKWQRKGSLTGLDARMKRGEGVNQHHATAALVAEG